MTLASVLLYTTHDMRVLGNRLLVEPVTVPIQSTILIPDRSLPKPTRVRIVSVGSKVTEPELKPGTELDISGAVGFTPVSGTNQFLISVRDVIAFVQ